jgi:enoyl-CoA hydratase/3-hydroxyacyl-CoA dehydrogenase
MRRRGSCFPRPAPTQPSLSPPLSPPHATVLKALFDCLRRAHADPAVSAIVITGDGDRAFSAGFDIAQFASSSGGGGIDSSINDAFCGLLEGGPKPTVAAIASLALGGGLEVALACHARLATPGARLGLPELQLGILPGFGGTQRLPRLVGLQAGLQMILTSAPVAAEKALKMGLVDAVVPPADLLPSARAWALAMAAGDKPRLATLERTDRLPPLGEATPMLAFARAETAKRAPNLVHPLLTIDAIGAGIQHGGRAGLVAESRAFADAAALDTHKALVHIFFAQRSTRKVAGITDAGLSPRPVRSVGVIGGGLMGSGIATACLLAGMGVVLKEVNPTFLEAGVGRVKANFASRVKKGRMSAADAEATLSRLTPTLDYADFASVDMVIEAALEDLKLKQQIFVEVAAAVPPHAILSTNTSTIDIAAIAARLSPADAARLVGNHFFSPAHIMPLLEIVRAPGLTDPQAVLDTLAFGAAIKKTPVVVTSCTGFAVNRVFFPYTQAACLLADLGASPYAIDAALGPGGGFGMPMGPFRLSDLVGADVGLHVGSNFVQAFPERVYKAGLILALNQAKRLGEKSGAGFYKYGSGRKAAPDPAGLGPLLDAARADAAAAGLPAVSLATPADIAEFVLFPVVNEGCRVIAERVVDKPADLDVASVLAMGFPPYRGGLIKWADLVGPRRVAARLSEWAALFEPAGLGGFFKPCPYLAAAAAAGTALGAGVPPDARL